MPNPNEPMISSPAVEHVVLRDVYDEDVPPRYVLVVSALGSLEGTGPVVFLEPAEYSQRGGSTVLESSVPGTTVEVQVLIDSINLLLGARLVLIDEAGLTAVSR